MYDEVLYRRKMFDQHLLKMSLLFQKQVVQELKGSIGDCCCQAWVRNCKLDPHWPCSRLCLNRPAMTGTTPSDYISPLFNFPQIEPIYKWPWGEKSGQILAVHGQQLTRTSSNQEQAIRCHIVGYLELIAQGRSWRHPMGQQQWPFAGALLCKVLPILLAKCRCCWLLLGTVVLQGSQLEVWDPNRPICAP